MCVQLLVGAVVAASPWPWKLVRVVANSVTKNCGACQRRRSGLTGRSSGDPWVIRDSSISCAPKPLPRRICTLDIVTCQGQEFNTTRYSWRNAVYRSIFRPCVAPSTFGDCDWAPAQQPADRWLFLSRLKRLRARYLPVNVTMTANALMRWRRQSDAALQVRSTLCWRGGAGVALAVALDYRRGEFRHKELRRVPASALRAHRPVLGRPLGYSRFASVLLQNPFAAPSLFYW